MGTWRLGRDVYPPELPEERCFCYYGNKLRSVLLPQRIWSDIRLDYMRQWPQDNDPGFRLVLELPPLLAQPLPAQRWRSTLDEFHRSMASIRAQTTGAGRCWCADSEPCLGAVFLLCLRRIEAVVAWRSRGRWPGSSSTALRAHSSAGRARHRWVAALLTNADERLHITIFWSDTRGRCGPTHSG